MKTEMPDVIVLLPGILGSVLKKDGKVEWGYSGTSIGSALFTGGASMKDALALPSDPSDIDDLEDGVTAGPLMPDLHLLPGLWKIDGYGKIAKTIKSRFKVTEGKNYYEFPYDWRRDNRVAALKLARQTKLWLDSWRRSGNEDAKLILIAHSMGGLVSHYFLEVLGGWQDTRALITFGTPFRGSLNALDTLSNGLKKFGFVDLSTLVRSFTSTYQLLPSYPAYDSGDGKLVVVGETKGIPNVEYEKAKAALAFHDEIGDASRANADDKKYRENGYSIYPIVGIDQPTNQVGRLVANKVRMEKTYGEKSFMGDGTVPHPSAIPHQLSEQGGDMYAATKHGSLQNASSALDHLFGRIHDFYLDLGVFRAAPPTGVRVGLEVDDLFSSEEEIRFALKASKSGVALRASLTDSRSDEVVGRISLAKSQSAWQEFSFGAFPPGAYTIRIEGDGVSQPVEDAIAVVDEAGPTGARGTSARF